MAVRRSISEIINKAIEILKSGVKLFEIEQKDGKELIYLTTEDEEDSILRSSTNIQIEIYQLYAEICEKIGDIQTDLIIDQLYKLKKYYCCYCHYCIYSYSYH